MILYTVAKDLSGELVRANSSDKGHAYFCPTCDSVLILRKSGSTKKNAKRPHFAHKALITNCNPESALHFTYKTLLAKKLQECIFADTVFLQEWQCKHCGDEHFVNLLQGVTSVQVEHNMKVCCPDIALFNANGKVIKVVEIVVTHPPEEAAIQFYKDNGVTLIQVNLSDDTEPFCNLELRHLRSVVTSTECITPKCIKCGSFKYTTKVKVRTGAGTREVLGNIGYDFPLHMRSQIAKDLLAGGCIVQEYYRCNYCEQGKRQDYPCDYLYDSNE